MGRFLFHGRKLISRAFSTLNRNPLHVCVVGSGPAGSYTAEKMLKTHEGAEVDIIDRLPIPFGLVRSGVAPDHPETKIVVNQFSHVAAHDKCSFFGNISFGINVSLSDLRKTYDVVVLAYGAESDRSLSVPAEGVCVVVYCEMAPDLKGTDTAVVLGQGNVALDVARILLQPTTELETTDIADYALQSLCESNIRKEYLVGRQEPVQAVCTAKELREILGTRNLRVHIQETDLTTSSADEEELKNNRIQRRVYKLFSKAATSIKEYVDSDQRNLHFVFFRKPDNFLPSELGYSVSGIHLEKTYLKDVLDCVENGASRKQVAVGTGEFEDLKCRLVLKSIGFKSIPVDGLPFDKYGVMKQSATWEQGLYVAGWLKRGPTGIIATNLYCAEETVSTILEDVRNGLLTSVSGSHKAGRQGLLQILVDKNVQFVPFGGWVRIDAKERMLGESKNKPREKITTWNELLSVADG